MAEEKAERRKTQKKLPPDDISAFCLQMSLLAQAGIPAAEGLAILQEDTADERENAWLQKAYDGVEMGEPLFRALEQTGVFPFYVLTMIEIGETTGRLDDVLQGLYHYYQREDDFLKTIKSAVTYPAVMVVMMTVVIVVLMTQVLPIFNQVFIQLGTAMSPVARGLMHASTMMSRYAASTALVLGVLVVAGFVFQKTRVGKNLLERIGEACFSRGNFSLLMATRRFASAMAMNLASGLDMDRALEMTARLVDHPRLAEKIKQCQQLTLDGMGFAEAVSRTGIFTGMYAKMLTVGFRTGKVEVMMQEIAERYAETIDAKMGRMIGMVEPALVAILSIVVGLILLAVMLPLMGIMSSIIG